MSSQPEKHRRKNFARHELIGRLGNVLFQYASVYCIAKQSNLLPLFSIGGGEVSFLRDARSITSWAMFDQMPKPVVLRQERYCCSYDDEFENLSSEKNYTVRGYFQSWKYFEPCKEDVKRMLVFKDEFVAQAEAAVRALRLRFKHRVLVGVHVRMEDHTSPRARNSGKRIATPQFFICLLYTSPSPRDFCRSRMPSSA